MFANAAPLLHPFAVIRALTPQTSQEITFNNNDADEENADENENNSTTFNTEKKKKDNIKTVVTDPAAIDGVMIMTYDYSAGRYESFLLASLIYKLS